MAKNIDPNLRKIGEYLRLEKDTIFTIPEYQRAYSWGIDNCDKLWNDIIDFTESDNKDNYFFGTIIINCQDNDTRYDLIDGQQRTTTFLLLLKALLISINTAIIEIGNDEDSVQLKNGLEERRRKIIGILYKVDAEDISNKPDVQKDAVICKGVNILENYSINEQFEEDLAIILQEIDFVHAEQKVKKIPYKQKDNKYTNFFRNYKYFYTQASEISYSQLNKITKAIIDKCEVIEIKSWQVEQAITMFNSLNSDGLPLQDADIISAKLYASAEHYNLRSEFVDKWEELLSLIEELKRFGVSDIDSILMQHMYYERTVRKETISEGGAIIVTTPGLRRYYIDINKDLLNHPLELTDSLINLSKSWIKAIDYPCVQVLLRFNDNAKLFLSGYFYRFDAEDITEDFVRPIAECLLKLFVILELVDVGYSSSLFKSFLFGVEGHLINNNVSVDIIIEKFIDHININWKEEDIRDSILGFDKNVLVYLNEYLFAKAKKTNFSILGKHDIEHIMPYSGNNIQVIRNDAGIKDEEEFKSTVNKLGNKILLEEKINRSIGNEWFRTKVSTSLKDKTGYIDSKFPLAQLLVEEYSQSIKSYWKKSDIEDATQKASDRIIDFIFSK